MSKEDPSNKSKRPPSSLSTGSADSGVFSSGVHVAHSSISSQHSSGSGPPSPTAQLNSLLFQTANLLAVNEQLKKEIAENKQIQQSIQMRSMNNNNNINNNNQVAAPPPHSPNFIFLRSSRGERRMQKPESYKTVICQAWLESKMCTFAENCRFAHGEEELRPSKIEPRQNNKYKTKLCDKYTTTGLCPYGKRCLFIHPDHGPNAYIRADKLFEVSQRHALADLRDQMETQIMTGGRNTLCQLPPQVLESCFGKSPSSIQQKGPGTPVAYCEANRPHPSWPLEASSYFAPAPRAVSPQFNHQVISPSSAQPPYFMTGAAQPEDDSMTISGGGFDHLAEDMAKHLELW